MPSTAKVIYIGGSDSFLVDYLNVKQYSESSMTTLLKKLFEKIKYITVDHKTPMGTIQNFVFCSFRKLQAV
ncbi:MAG TPA: hypothetical protein VIL78_17885 [Hanamia sp.]